MIMSETEDEWILGFGGSTHDFSAALSRGSDIQVAVEAERVSRVKYGHPAWFGDPLRGAAEYCLAAADVSIDQIARRTSSDLLASRTLQEWDIHAYPHHLCHAASAVMMLPPATRACVIVYDGNGSAREVHPGRPLPSELTIETFSFFEFADCQLRRLGGTYGQRQTEWLGLFDGGTNSAGQLYELVTVMLGFQRTEAGKTMGLAAWGKPRLREALHEHLEIGQTMQDVLTVDPFAGELQERITRHLHDAHDPFSARADLAASAQAVLDECLLRCYDLIADLDFDVLCVAGGCGLNTVSNGVLAERLAKQRRLLVPPHAGDAGIALGSLWLDARERTDEAFQMTLAGRPLMPHVGRPGRAYPASRIRHAIGEALPGASYDPGVSSPPQLARVLARGDIVGVFNGSSEIGPRALGGRSILADPRSSARKERINREIKHREPFRPLAPMILAEHFSSYFAPPGAANEFMLVIAQANDTCAQLAPAVVHVDGSARVQVLGKDGDPFLVALLEAFNALTGVPILLNTSFNQAGEPIVETPEEAIAAALAMQLDGLWLDGHYISPVASPRATH
jgi:carbamoyltransferase